MVLCVYTDGMCKNNGKNNTVAGYGIYFGRSDERNVSKKLSGYVTNNIAEISAIIHALEILKSYTEPVEIYTDSKYSILVCTTYGEKCYKNNWKNPNNKKKEIPNLELVKKAYLLSRELSNVSFHYIRAHTNASDQHSEGNAKADELANLSIFT